MDDKARGLWDEWRKIRDDLNTPQEKYTAYALAGMLALLVVALVVTAVVWAVKVLVWLAPLILFAFVVGWAINKISNK